MNAPTLLQKDANTPILQYFAPQDVQIITAWLAGRNPNTMRAYRKALFDLFKVFPRRSLGSFTGSALEVYIKSKRDLKPASVKLAQNAISSLFTFAARDGHIPRNVAVILKPIKVPDRSHTKVLSEEQISWMIKKEPSERNRLIIKTLYYTAVRVEELSKLTVGCFLRTPEGAVVVVEGKGSKIRTINVPMHLYEELVQFWNKEGYLPTDPAFKSRKKGHLHPSAIWRAFVDSAKRAGISCSPTPHWMRHSSATHAIDAGASPRVVQHTLGHESLQTTTKYVDRRPKESNGDYLKKV